MIIAATMTHILKDLSANYPPKFDLCLLFDGLDNIAY